MDVAIKHLISRNGKFYFRYRLPSRYCADGNCEIKISLKTNDLKKAASACKLASEKMQSLIDSGALQMASFEQIREILKKFMEASAEDQERHIAGYGKICEETRSENRKSMLSLCNHIENALAGPDYTALRASFTAEQLLRDIPHTPEDVNWMAKEYLREQLALARARCEFLEGRRYSVLYNELDHASLMSPQYPKAKEIMEAEKFHSLGELADAYLKAPHSWGAGSGEAAEKTLKLFMEHVLPETDIKTIRRRDILEFRDNILRRMPARRAQRAELRELSFTEQLENRAKMPVMARQTINNNITRLGGFFVWCLDREYIDQNPAARLQVKRDDKVSNERKPYSAEDLERMFVQLREDNLNAWKPHKLWIPLISLYSGARQNEICQLQVENIIAIDGIPCLEITENEETGARVKNQSSRRIIPVHPTLLKLGFLTEVLRRIRTKRGNRAGDNRLWITLEYTAKYGYAHAFEKFFSRFNRRHVTADTKKVFHSLRHTLANNLKQRGAQESLVAEIMGHTIPGMTFGRYGKDFKPSVLLENLKMLDYGFDIFKCLNRKPLDEATIQEQIAELPVRKL